MKRLLGAALVAAALWPAVPAQAKDYSFPEVSIDATILPDGTLELVERRTFSFDGDFSFAFFTIDDHDRYLIEDFTVTQDGQPLTVEEGFSDRAGFKGTWYFDAHDEDITFTISYRARCAVDVYADTAHLLWQFVGRGWDKDADHLLVTLRVPGRAADPPARPDVPCDTSSVGEVPGALPAEPLARGDVLAWGHGPLGGEVRLPDPHTVTFEINDLRAETFVEGSVLLPVESVPLAYQQPIPKRAEVLSEEGALAAAANAARREFLANRRTGRFLLFLIPLAMLGLVVIARVRDRVPGVPRHLEEPPDDTHPAELAHVWSIIRRKGSTENAYRTQLLHLARVGALEIEAVGRVTSPEDFTIRWKEEPEAALDKEFMDFLFPDGTKPDSVKLKKITATGSRATELREWTTLLTSKTKGKMLRFLQTGTRLESWVLAAVAFGTAAWAVTSGAATILQVLFLAGLGIAPGVLIRLVPFALRNPGVAFFGAVMFGAFVVPILLPVWLTLRDGGFVFTAAHWAVAVAFAGWIAALRFIPERFPAELRERIARWGAFRRYLKNFSALPDAPTMAVVVWEKYMVYATALGVAGEVEKQVRALVSPEELVSPFAGAPSGLDGLTTYRAFSSTPISSKSYSAFAASSSSFSSGSGSFSGGGGGGGGFSGGGGGGGGGTGGGAG